MLGFEREFFQTNGNLRIHYPGGGKETKVVLFGSAEGSSGLASYPTIIDASNFLSIVIPVLVSLETALALWVELAHVFRYRFADL